MCLHFPAKKCDFDALSLFQTIHPSRRRRIHRRDPRTCARKVSRARATMSATVVRTAAHARLARARPSSPKSARIKARAPFPWMSTRGRETTARARASRGGDEVVLGELSERVSRVRDGSGARTYGVVTRAPLHEDVFDGLASRAGRARASRGAKRGSTTTTRFASEDGASAPGAVLELVTVPRTRTRTMRMTKGNVKRERGEALSRLFEPL